MVATTWVDDVARARRLRLKSMGGETLAPASKISAVRNYIVGKTTSPLSSHSTEPSAGWENLVLVVHCEASPASLRWKAVLTATKDDAAWQAFPLLHSELLQLRQRSDFDAISSMLDSLARRGSTVHPMLLVAGLRLTYLYRSDVPRWEATRDEIAKKLSSRGLDPSEILIGLLK